MGDHPVKVPAELFTEWIDEAMRGHAAWRADAKPGTIAAMVADRAAQWGADQELDACEEWLITGPYGASIVTSAPTLIADLRAARRPKPPSLAEQALEQYERIEDVLRDQDVIPAGCIRAALTRLAELEANQ